LAYLKKPAIFVPLFDTTESHQLENAKFLAKYGLCVFTSEKNIYDNLVTTIIKILENNNRLQFLGNRIHKLAKPLAREYIFKVICYPK
jgi:UDP-N-acetylglucosamine:LPS N-acetylglucosamine transferase